MSKTPDWALERIKEAKEMRFKELDLSRTIKTEKLKEFPFEVFELIWLESLFLYDNEITEIPESITELQNLTKLDLARNQIIEIPDSITKLQNLTELNLAINQIIEIPDSIAKLANLTTLNLGSNQLTEIPDSIAKLANLTTLYLSYSQLTEIPDSITKLSNLTRLDLNSNQITEIPYSIAKLSNLTRLDLSSNQLTKIPDSIIKLQNLTKLDLYSNEITDIPDSITKLKNLTALLLDYNQITEIPDSIIKLQKLTELNLCGNQLTQVSDSIIKLQNLKRLYLRGIQLTDIPDSITKLQNLTKLDLARNQLTEIPDSIVKLKKLEGLFLQRNKITKIPNSTYDLKSLEYLDLDENDIDEISPKILKLENLRNLKLKNNPIVSPPPEVVEKGVEAIKDYFRQIEKAGTDKIYEAKFLIVGEGGAGKTTLAKKIKNPKYKLDKKEISTEGIDVKKWEFPIEGGKKFRANIWDFGGQEIYHSTHQFFLSRRSLYVLVADSRNEDTDFYYWLNCVDLLSESSPILIIKNEKQDRKRNINERQLRAQFDNLKEMLATNLATNRGLDTVVDNIKFHIQHLPLVGKELPATWVNVRKSLEDDRRDYISLKEYFEICDQNGFKLEKDKLQLSGYLHDLGVCLHFQEDPLLKRTVILNPEWGTDAVYKVLDNKEILENRGRFTRGDLDKIWHEKKYDGMRDELLHLMINFKLCYEIPGEKDTFIAPQLLTENQPEYEWDEADNLIMRYTYVFMPKGILSRFIVAMHKLIADQDCVWKSGLIIEKDNTKAEIIEYYGKREIHIRVSGKFKKDLMTIISYELDEILNTFSKLQYDKLIPCNCKSCRNNIDPHFYLFDELREFLSNRQDEIQCRKKPYQMVNVWSLIDDVIDLKMFTKGKKDRDGKYVFGDIEKLIIQEKGDIIMNEKTINIGDGNTINAPVTIADHIENSFNTLAQSDIGDERKDLLKELLKAINEVNKNAPAENKEDAEQMASDAETLIKEVVKTKPRRDWYKMSLKGIKDAAVAIGAIAKPVLEIVAILAPLL